MNKISYAILSLLLPFSLSSQQLSGQSLYESDFKSFISVGIGTAVGTDYQHDLSFTLNTYAAIEPHLGKGYYVGVGLNHHGFPRNTDNMATYAMLYFTKGFYVVRKLGFYVGLGGTIGVSSKGHPGCCVGGAYVVLSAIFDVQKYFAFGLNTQFITDFDDLTTIPGIRISVRF